MNRIIRPMQPQDAPVLAQIDAQDNPNPWTKNQFLQELTLPYSRLLVGLVDQKIYGFIAAWIVQDCLQILELAIDRSWRRQGLAQHLVNELCKQSACKKAELELRCNNLPALSLYKKIGFVPVGLRPNFYQNTDGLKIDAILMDKKL